VAIAVDLDVYGLVAGWEFSKRAGFDFSAFSASARGEVMDAAACDFGTAATASHSVDAAS
jgi:hypothetical protein